MSDRKCSFWCRSVSLVLALALVILLPLVAACGDDEEETTPTKTATPTVTTSPTPGPTVTTSPTPGPTVTTSPTPGPTVTTSPTPKPTGTQQGEKIKLGIIASWTGPFAYGGPYIDRGADTTLKQVEKLGGIEIGGVLHPLQIIRVDDTGTVAGSAAAFTKLVDQDKVQMIVLGGSSGAQIAASIDQAEQFHMPFVNASSSPASLADKPYSVRSTYKDANVMAGVADFVLNQLKPQSAGFLADDTATQHDRVALLRDLMKAGGVKIVYEQYVPSGTADLSSYITRIKYANPDIVFGIHASATTYTNTFKQMKDMGGWGNLKYVSPLSVSSSTAVVSDPMAVGTYHVTPWLPGLSYPANQSFEQLYMEAVGKAPGALDWTIYFAFQEAIAILKAAGPNADGEKIAQVARSGQVQWDSIAGPMKIGSDGEINMTGVVVKVTEPGKLEVVGGIK